VHTRWIETEFHADIPPFAGSAAVAEEAADAQARERITVEVGGKRIEVVLPADLAITGAGGATRGGSAPRRRSAKKVGAAISGDTLASPMQGTIVKVAVEEGQEVEAGDLVVVLEAMKMEQPLNAHKSGTVTTLAAQVGAAVTSGEVICSIIG
jgi:acetyl-CoA/propionyl-CoA carboxylase biotin carboxyl carrier protein